MKLLKLDINAFRGATQPFSFEFDGSKKLTMIFGENGTGKTTIADAITCLCTDTLGSIGDKSGSGKPFLASIGASPNDVLLKLATDSDEYSATLSGNKFSKNTGKSYPKLRQLRRSQIVKLIEAQPATRYEELKDYIDVENILKSENGLRDLGRNLANELNTQTSTLASATLTLERAWKDEGSPMGNWKKWAELETGKNLHQEQEKVERINALVSAWESVERNIALLKEKEDACEVVAKRKADHSLKLQAFEAGDQSINQELIILLESAGKFIQKQANLHECPLCSSPVEKDALLDTILKTVQSHSEYQQLLSTKKTLEQDEKRTGDFLQSAQQTLSSALTSLGLASKEFSYFEPSRWDSWQQTGLPLMQQIELFQGSLTTLEHDITALKAERTKAQSSISQNNLIKNQLKSIIENQKKAEETERLLFNTKEAFKIVETSRKEYIDEELASISGEVEAMYQSLHPGENIGGIELTLNPNYKNSLELSASFAGQTNIPPQSVYSESHLDTLGLCVFLALAKKYGGKETILLLDDVVMSVDEHHLDRFIYLLHSLAKEFSHILITTHYRPWKDRYRQNRAPLNEVHFVELKRWSMMKGMQKQNGRADVQELTKALADPYFDRQRVANLAGTTLENMLDFLTLRYSSRMPRKPGNDFTLSELLDGVSSKKLISNLKIQHIQVDAVGNKTVIKEELLKPLVDELKELKAVRNQVGAHFNFDGSLVSDDDVETFARQTLVLAELMVCPQKGDFPTRDKSGSYFESMSGAVRLYPLREPAN
jgi:ABC-type Mn2+/Zn2+ transport system ATPase subunit